MFIARTSAVGRPSEQPRHAIAKARCAASVALRLACLRGFPVNGVGGAGRVEQQQSAWYDADRELDGLALCPCVTLDFSPDRMHFGIGANLFASLVTVQSFLPRKGSPKTYYAPDPAIRLRSKPTKRPQHFAFVPNWTLRILSFDQLFVGVAPTPGWRHEGIQSFLIRFQGAGGRTPASDKYGDLPPLW
jgi:hypothetical protein